VASPPEGYGVPVTLDVIHAGNPRLFRLKSARDATGAGRRVAPPGAGATSFPGHLSLGWGARTNGHRLSGLRRGADQETPLSGRSERLPGDARLIALRHRRTGAGDRNSSPGGPELDSSSPRHPDRVLHNLWIILWMTDGLEAQRASDRRSRAVDNMRKAAEGRRVRGGLAHLVCGFRAFEP
jgi:hypothetical protein